MKKKYIMKTILVTFVITLSLAVIGFSYAYFSTEITGEGKYVTLDTANLKLKYTDNTVLSLDNAIPGDFATKTFTVENIGTEKVSYNIVWNNLINTINNYDLQLDMKCKSYKNYNTSSKVESGECSSFYKAVPYTETSISKDIKRNNEIDIGITHEYTVTITFKNRSYNQKDNLNKQFSGKIDLEEYVDSSPEPVYCTFDGTLTQGAEYVNGQYTYRYKQEGDYASSGLEWYNISTDGWGVQLTDKASTNAVTSKVCTYINNVPITSMSYMFSDSKATTLDVSNFDTSKVTDMSIMFYNSTNLKTIYVSNKFNTDKVTDSTSMFSGCTKLIGGAGTKYNSSYVDKTYARIDGGTNNPGYFTDINNQPSTFSTDDWTTIISSVKSGNTRGYKVGETKEVSLGTAYGTHTLRIANTSTPSECSTEGFSQSACGFVLEFTDSVTNSVMNSGSTDTNVGGWNSSLVRTLVNGKIYNALPSDLKKGIINTTVVSGHGEGDKSNFSSTDKLYLLSPIEVWSYDNSDNAIKTDTSRFLTRQLDYYASIGVTTSNYSGAIKKNNPSLNFDWWWLRSAYSKDSHTFFAVKPNGDWFWIGTRSNYTGVSPAFRIG